MARTRRGRAERVVAGKKGADARTPSPIGTGLVRVLAEDAEQDIRALGRVRDLCRELHYAVGLIGRGNETGLDYRQADAVERARNDSKAARRLQIGIERFLGTTDLLTRDLPIDAHVARAALRATCYAPTIAGIEPLSRRAVERATSRSGAETGVASQEVKSDIPPMLCERCGGKRPPERLDERKGLCADLIRTAVPVVDNKRRVLEKQWLCASCYDTAVLLRATRH